MDPLSTAFAFSSIVALIGQFRSERGAKVQADFNEFMVWLSETNHEGILESLQKNRAATDAVGTLLNEQYDTLLRKISSIDNALASFSSGYDGFRELSLAIRPEAELSSSGLSILRQFEESGGSKILESQTWDGPRLLYLDAQGAMEIPDRRFFEDDLAILVELGFLRHRYNDNGDNVYVFTRQASDFVKQMNS